MAIHPIDLSSVYGQMDNVAKFNASADKMAALTGQVNENKNSQQALQQSKTVQQTAKDDTLFAGVKNDRHAPDNSRDERESKDEKSSEEEEENPQWEITDPSLGQHIDITT